MNKPQFNPDWRNLPIAYKTKTRKGKHVFRIRLNTDELLSRFEEGKTVIAIDIPVKYGKIPVIKGRKKAWEGLNFYCWAMEKEKLDELKNGEDDEVSDM